MQHLEPWFWAPDTTDAGSHPAVDPRNWLDGHRAELLECYAIATGEACLRAASAPPGCAMSAPYCQPWTITRVAELLEEREGVRLDLAVVEQAVQVR